MKHVDHGCKWMVEHVVNARTFRGKGMRPIQEDMYNNETIVRDWMWNAGLFISIIAAGFALSQYIFDVLNAGECLRVAFLGLITSIRVIVLIVLSSLVWIPVGVWLGQRPYIAQKAQAVIQFIAAFPANLFYPLCVIAIVRFNLNVEIWLTPLMILGTQWYILFNVIAGASAIPRDLSLAADNFGVIGWQWWRRLALPAIFPFYITGAISAAGGAWNASIVAEWVSWGSTTLQATGLGEYIHANTLTGNFHKLALGTVMMCVYVLLFNQLIWRPLYRRAEARFNY
jgi:NitT/TauT family transport system permease protein